MAYSLDIRRRTDAAAPREGGADDTIDGNTEAETDCAQRAGTWRCGCGCALAVYRLVSSSVQSHDAGELRDCTLSTIHSTPAALSSAAKIRLRADWSPQ
jgi:hypothetical protein